MNFRLLIFPAIVALLLCSCKKQEQDPVPVYDTLQVTGGYIEYGLKNNVILTLRAYHPDAIQYSWTPGGQTTQQITISDMGLYAVSISTHSATLVYQVLVYLEGSEVYIPNSFTPNNDGLNDTWRPVSINISASGYSLRIYDESNITLFSTNDPQSAWDGNHNGTVMPPAYYYYFLEYQTNTGENKSRSGMLQLVR